MWAFAIWDNHEKALFCSRDRFGIKPFYYFDNGEYFVFASEIRAILASGIVDPEPCSSSVVAYLGHGVVDGREETFFSGIHRLMPAHSLRITNGRKRYWRYWDCAVAGLDAECAVADRGRVRDAVKEAVRSHLLSDAPLGYSLSGGLDSGAIVSLAPKLRQGSNSVFTAWFYEGSQFDERRYADMIAESCATDMYTIEPDKDALLELLPGIIWHLEEPPMAHGVYARWHIAQLASHHVKVLMVGQGADEIFAGYPAYYEHYLHDCQVHFGKLSFYRELWASLGSNSARYSSSRLQQIRQYLRLILQYSKHDGYSPPPAVTVLGERLKDELSSTAPPAGGRPATTTSQLNRRLYRDVTSGLLSTLLKYDDKIGMAFSVECRVPFLDYRLVELAFSLSPFAKMRQGWTKKIFRDAMTGIVPPAILWRADKMPYPMPANRWFRSELLDQAEERILDGAATARGYLDRTRLEELLAGYRARRFDITHAIWHWLCLSLWLEISGKLPDRSLAAAR
jgi:asparagine synthase (glutamine-hydrolysing)